MINAYEEGVELNQREFEHLLDEALKVGNYKFLKKCAILWLDKYPHDLDAEFYLAHSLRNQNDSDNAYRLLIDITNRDPEFLEAWKLLLKLTPKRDPGFVSSLAVKIYCLGGNVWEKYIPPNWGEQLKKVKELVKQSNYLEADERIRTILAAEPQEVLIGIEHLRITKALGQKNLFDQLAKIYHERWPETIQIALWTAESAMECGEEPLAVNLLHKCAAADPGAQVAKRVWGEKNEYLSLWPNEMKVVLNIPIPSQITIPLGWNRLLPGEVISINESVKAKSKGFVGKGLRNLIKNIREPVSKDGEDHNSAEEYEKKVNALASKIKQHNINSNESRFPVYVILTMQSGLEGLYGQKSSGVIISHLKELVNIINKNPDWRSLLFMPDNQNCMNLFDLEAIYENDPWKIKSALVDLDKYLLKKGEMIGCVLIVGGHNIVPFHSLPNPTQDKDIEVLSDNPYSTADSNYFAPEWLLGRLPGENNNDPGLLLKQIRQVIQDQGGNTGSDLWWKSISDNLLSWFNIVNILKNILHKKINYGVTASVWRRSSLSVFRPIGNGDYLRVSPPYTKETIDIDRLIKSKFAYFNLHGLAETPNWYGQRDITERDEYPDFPVSISANQLSNLKSCPQVVFSEACYGGYIQGKTVDQSIALRFRELGTLGFIGSTSISYGSVYTPLIGADLLAFLFWKYLCMSYPIGSAFNQAKLSFAKITMQRQGYMDGEDQKTLMSFVLYGDPLAVAEKNKSISKVAVRFKPAANFNTVGDQNGIDDEEMKISGEILSQIKGILKDYLPGLDSAEVKIRKHHVVFPPHNDATLRIQNNNNPVHSDHTIVTYSKAFNIHKQVHYQYARVTVNEHGKVIKLAISR